MKRSFPVVDADGHVIERDRELREFLPAPYRGVAGKREYPLFSWDGWARGALSPHKREHPDAKLWTRFLDATEICIGILNHPFFLARAISPDRWDVNRLSV